MSDEFFYKLFGQEFGPVPLDSLVELAREGHLGDEDEVREANSGRWVSAISVLHSGSAKATETIVASPPDGPAAQTAVAEEWFCKVFGEEIGPFDFDELLLMAERGQLSDDDQVKFGRRGKWRRAGSVPRIHAVMPQAPATIDASKPSPPRQSASPPRMTSRLPASASSRPNRRPQLRHLRGQPAGNGSAT